MTQTAGANPYVLITAARNEATCIERTIASVARQTRPPAAWAVVSDGSTDGTDEPEFDDIDPRLAPPDDELDDGAIDIEHERLLLYRVLVAIEIVAVITLVRELIIGM